MSQQRLTVRTECDCVIIDIAWCDGMVQRLSASARCEKRVDEWITHGLDELIGEREDVQPRHTDSSSPDFLQRLGEYLGRQFSFDISLAIDGATYRWQKTDAHLPREEERKVKVKNPETGVTKDVDVEYVYDSAESAKMWQAVYEDWSKLYRLMLDESLTKIGALPATEPAQLKYPDKCPCQIQAVDCKYHAGVKNG